TLIALAIAAALPVAAQADVTISGSLTTKLKNTGVIDTDSRLSVASSEVLANGMTATAGFSITADTDDDTENSGTASLAGDFGTLTVGSIDADSAFQAGDVAGTVADTTHGASSTVSTVYGIHYAGTQAGLSVAAQVNANTNAAGVATLAKSTQMSATYDFNGVTVGYGYASADSDADTAKGVNAAVNTFGVSYSFGDLAVTAGKASTSADSRVSATYTMVVDALTVKAQMDNEPTGDYQIDLTYALSDAVSLSSEIDSTTGKETTLVATYTSGDMTASVSKTDDGTTDASVALDFGNADLTLARNGGDADTSITYKVAF
ncbi:MAG: porin, partial [Pseudomonadales bacterium]|nr:porin [Pseudomonadales bacterium]